MNFDKAVNQILKESRFGQSRYDKYHDADGNALGGGYDDYQDDPGGKKEAARFRDHDRGPWYLLINGKVFKQQGQPKAFDWKKGANNYALAMLKNNPSLDIKLTKKAEDKAPDASTQPPPAV